MHVLRTTNLCKTYVVNKRQNNVLRNINLTIEDKEMVAVMGPSGSGKTTLLYSISGMEDVTAGDVEFYGRKLTTLNQNELSDLRLHEMGFVFQQMYVLKNLSVYDNIILPAFQGTKRKAKEEREAIHLYARKLMQKLGISDIGDHAVSEVSGGQLQRAIICRAMINHPKIIFADEPTGALNKQSSQEVMQELNRIHEEGTTILLVTHDLKVASRCERILYIEDGDIRDEFHLGPWINHQDDGIRRERSLNEWLFKLGW